MTVLMILQVIIYLLIIILLVKPLGWYIACVYENKFCGINKIFEPGMIYLSSLWYSTRTRNGLEKLFNSYVNVQLFRIFICLYLSTITIDFTLNPQRLTAVSPEIAFNTAVSFVTNTDWQSYAGEKALSYFTQMMALTVQNFLSAATSMSMLMALIRGLVRHETTGLGIFWVETVRVVLYILMPLAFIFAIILTSQGVIQNFKSYQKINLLQPISYQQDVIHNIGQINKDTQNNANNELIKLTQQTVPMGPVASQIAIKQLGSNGGGVICCFTLPRKN